MLFHIKLIGVIAMMITLTVSCDEEKVGQYPIEDIPPGAITNVQTEATPGGANITYDLPNETDISYVICEYEFAGEIKVARSSVYSNFITIEGLGEIAPCEYSIYLVDHNENRSEPYTGSFTPLEPPYQTIFKTITMEPDFGGVVIRWQNETNALIGAFLYALNDSSDWEEFDLVFSTQSEEKKSIRGYNTDERMFGVSLVDQFGNRTDTFMSVQVPLYEKELNKDYFSNGHLLGDNNTIRTGRPIENIWDGDLNVMWHTDPSAGFIPPQTFTIDLGVEAKLSRGVIWNRQDGYIFSQHNVRYFEVWGAKELSHGFNDSYWQGNEWQNEWTFLGDFEEIKPSGILNLNESTDEDAVASANGSEFIFESGVGEMRYLRFVVKETWARTAALHIAEVSIFGDDGVREE